jgi:hypothetical protein
VNREGRRFCNELDRPYLEFFDQPGRVGYLVLDAKLATEFSAWPNYVSTAPDIAYAYVADYRRLCPDIYHEGATAEALAAAAGLPAEALRSTLDTARRHHENAAQAAFLTCDVTDSRQVTAVFDHIVAEAGRLDILVNCAGGFWQQLSVEDTPEEAGSFRQCQNCVVLCQFDTASRAAGSR